MRVTIKDIAKAAGLSYSSVSRALNGLKGVSEETREEVKRIAEEMDYYPNAVAQGLVRQRTGTIGLILPDITNPFYPELVRGVEEKASSLGFNTFFCNTNYDLKKEESYIRNLLEKRVDGIILAPSTSDSLYLEQRSSLPVPCIYLGNAPINTRHSFVITDNYRGGLLAAETLIARGYRSIGFISGNQNRSITDGRYQGFIDAMAEHKLETEKRFIIQETWRFETGYSKISEMIGSGAYPEAVIAGNDFIALGVIQGAREAGLRIPEDIALIGFDDIPDASWPDINLTTIRQPKIQMGGDAVSLLLELIGKGEAPVPDELLQRDQRREILDPILILRGTC